jgi:hypothetical protein
MRRTREYSFEFPFHLFIRVHRRFCPASLFRHRHQVRQFGQANKGQMCEKTTANLTFMCTHMWNINNCDVWFYIKGMLDCACLLLHWTWLKSALKQEIMPIGTMNHGGNGLFSNLNGIFCLGQSGSCYGASSTGAIGKSINQDGRDWTNFHLIASR